MKYIYLLLPLLLVKLNSAEKPIDYDSKISNIMYGKFVTKLMNVKLINKHQYSKTIRKILKSFVRELLLSSNNNIYFVRQELTKYMENISQTKYSIPHYFRKKLKSMQRKIRKYIISEHIDIGIKRSYYVKLHND